jgi:hypothetical protein
VAFLRTLKTDPDQIVVSVIGPPADCTIGVSPADVAPRLLALVEAFGSHGTYVSSCGDAPVTAFLQLSSRLAELRSVECLGGVRDDDATVPGVQATCSVEDTSEQIDGTFATAVLPGCDTAPPPCWRLVTDSVLCAGTAALLQIDRGPDFCPWLSTKTQVSCVGAL